jgi:hypothetical protein
VVAARSNGFCGVHLFRLSQGVSTRPPTGAVAFTANSEGGHCQFQGFSGPVMCGFN